MKKMWNVSIEPNVLPGMNIEPILGEFAWHSITGDPTILDISKAHFQSILGELKSNDILKNGLKILEVGAYAHITGYMLADEIKANVTLADISESTLSTGYKIAMKQGFNNVKVERVSCDFHTLPFQSNEFDVVYIASALHHTWRYQKVLSELARVTANDGLLILENEPLRRNLCFYEFRTNRPDNFDKKETSLAKYDLLRTIAEPYFGSRSELLFGMTENQEMDLKNIIGDISSEFNVRKLSLDPTICMGELDHEIDKKLLNARERGRKVIFDQVRENLTKAESDQSIKQYLDKIKLSQSTQYIRLDSLVSRIDRDFRLSLYSSGVIIEDKNLEEIITKLVDPLQLNRALLFGGSFRLVATKVVSSKKVDISWPIIKNGLVSNGFEPTLNKILDNSAQLFPSIQTSTHEDLKNAFGPDWDISISNEIVIANPNKPEPTILLSHDSSGSLLVSVRVFAVVEDTPWSLGLYVDDELRAYVEFSKSDSALLVASVSNAISPSCLTFKALKGEIYHFNVSHLSIVSINN